MQYFVQNWAKRHERLGSITRNIDIGPGSHRLLQNTNKWQRRPELKCKGEGQYSERERTRTRTRRTLDTGQQVWSVWLLAENATKLKSDRETFTFTRTGPQACEEPSSPQGTARGLQWLSWTARERAIHTGIRVKHSDTRFTLFTVAPSKSSNIHNIQ